MRGSTVQQNSGKIRHPGHQQRTGGCQARQLQHSYDMMLLEQRHCSTGSFAGHIYSATSQPHSLTAIKKP